MRSLVPALPGVPWWGAPVVAAGIIFLGLLVDAARGNELTSAFTVFYVLGSIVAVAAVRYRGLFTAMVQPPLLLLVAVPLGQEFLASGSMSGLKDIALNIAYPLIERFPAMFLATLAAVGIGAYRIVSARKNHGARARSAQRRTPRARSAAPSADSRRAQEPRRAAARTRPTMDPAEPRRAAARRSAPRDRIDPAPSTQSKAAVRDGTTGRPSAAPRKRATPAPGTPRPASNRAAAPAPQQPSTVAADPLRAAPPSAPRTVVQRPAAPGQQTAARPAPRVRYRDRYED